MGAPKDQSDSGVNVREVRLVADLRIMHAKVDELHHIVHNLQRRHSQEDVHKYADADILAENIRRVDEIYIWFVRLKEETERLDNARRKRPSLY